MSVDRQYPIGTCKCVGCRDCLPLARSPGNAGGCDTDVVAGRDLCNDCWSRQIVQGDLSTGSGDFSIGSKVWSGTSKLIEEMGELQQVLGKLIATPDANHWDGDLRKMLVEEIGDLSAALDFFKTQNCTLAELLEIAERANEKLALFRRWHKNPTWPT